MHRLKQIGELFIQNRWILCQGIFGIYMIILSVMDLKKKKLDLLDQASRMESDRIKELVAQIVPTYQYKKPEGQQQTAEKQLTNS